MPSHIFETKLGIVGCGRFCKSLLEFLWSEDFAGNPPQVLGVADRNQSAEGLRYAQSRGVFTTTDYTEIYRLPGIETILELTYDPELPDQIRKTKPSHLYLVDHFEARSLWDVLQVETEKKKILKNLRQHDGVRPATVELFEKFAERLISILKRRHNRSREIEIELFEHERTLFQIIQGSTIPTFVLNQDHLITHWNKALERLTGFKAERAVGTKLQWAPFYVNERPTMADVILDQIQEQEIRKLYGAKWRKSQLIEGAYEAEGFFPRLGENGKWCWFTAAPIKAPDSKIIGAIETLWDKTEDKKAEEERERHTRELSALCSIYAALNSPWDIDERIRAAIQETRTFLNAESICIFVYDENDRFYLKYNFGASKSLCLKNQAAGKNSIIYRVAQSNELIVYENLSEGDDEKIGLLESEGLKSLAYIPISAKEEKVFGVIRIGSRQSQLFDPEARRVLELIGNRIGVAIENAMLQEQYIRSEEKYRSLFNNDPNPIFILNSRNFRILDTNQRAEATYGYSREELIGMPFLELGNKQDEEVAGRLQSISRERSVLFSKKRHFKKGGKPFFVNINVSPAEYGESYVLIASTTDISESIEKETQLIQASKMTTLGVMAAGMAHEINQPLNVIQICADFFLKSIGRGDTIKDEDMKMLANDIVENVQRITGVIKHVRDFARQSEVIRSKVNINDPINDIFKVLGHQIKVHQIDLSLELDPNLPIILAEHNRLEQVFINLVTNAIDAMDEKAEKSGAKKVEKRLTIQSFEQKGMVVVKVTDTGVGMPPEVKNKLFEPFFTTKKTGKGTGLGVSISYGIVRDYDGTIELESEVGKGTSFIIKFPAVQ